LETIKDLKAWLSEMPEDTKIQFGIQEPGNGYNASVALKLTNKNTQGVFILMDKQFESAEKNRFGDKFLKFE